MYDWIKKDGYSTKLVASSEDLNADGVQIEKVKFYSGKYKHHHKIKTEVFCFTSGKGRMILNGEEKEIRPGSSFVIKPNTIHEWINDSEEPMEAIMIKTNNDLEDTYTK